MMEPLWAVTLIIDCYLQVLAYAMDHNLSPDNIQIFIHPDVASNLELGESLCVESEGVKCEVAVIRDAALCQERHLANGAFETDVYIGDPNWGK